MSNEISDVQEFFDSAAKIKEERGTNYDNGGKSAYDIALDMFENKKRYSVGIWPVEQKASRLATLAQEAEDNELNAEAMNDTLIDLVNYAAMYWLRFVKPYLPVEEDSKEVVLPSPKKYANGGVAK